jgi:hypothetical protein
MLALILSRCLQPTDMAPDMSRWIEELSEKAVGGMESRKLPATTEDETTQDCILSNLCPSFCCWSFENKQKGEVFQKKMTWFVLAWLPKLCVTTEQVINGAVARQN